MHTTHDESSPVPKIKRETVSKYPLLNNGHAVASLDPAPIKERDDAIDEILRFVVSSFKMYLYDITLQFDAANLLFNRSASPSILNPVHKAILRRLAFDGISSGRISMPQNQQHYSLELITPGFQLAPTVLKKEIFSLVAVRQEKSI